MPWCDSRPDVVPLPMCCPACHNLPLDYRKATYKEVLKARLEEFLAQSHETTGRDTPCRLAEDNDCKTRSHL